MLFIPVLLLIFGVGILSVQMRSSFFGIRGGIGLFCIGLSILITATLYETRATFLAIFLFLLFLLFLYWFLKRNRPFFTMILQDSIDLGHCQKESIHYFMGKEGITVTALKPKGRAEFDGTIVEVCSMGEYIKKGKVVKVVGIDGHNIFVKQVYATEDNNTP